MSFFSGRKRNTGAWVAIEDKTGIKEALLLKYNNTVIRKINGR